jgi:hypothetical protein
VLEIVWLSCMLVCLHSEREETIYVGSIRNMVMESGKLRPDRRLRIIFVVGIFVAVMCGLFPPYRRIEVKLIAVATPLIEAEYFCGYSFLSNSRW